MNYERDQAWIPRSRMPIAKVTKLSIFFTANSGYEQKTASTKRRSLTNIGMDSFFLAFFGFFKSPN